MLDVDVVIVVDVDVDVDVDDIAVVLLTDVGICFVD